VSEPKSAHPPGYFIGVTREEEKETDEERESIYQHFTGD
jgi:hypothetical protein